MGRKKSNTTAKAELLKAETELRWAQVAFWDEMASFVRQYNVVSVPAKQETEEPTNPMGDIMDSVAKSLERLGVEAE